MFYMRVIEFDIKNCDDGKSVRDFLRGFGVSSALLTRLKQSENGITINNTFARTIDKIHTGDRLKICILNKGKMPAKLDDKRVKVAYNDNDILILNKPELMPVHESRNHQGDTLANVASCYMDEDSAFRAVYRLDRDTSGLVLIAKNELAASKLAGKIKKDYYAVVSGDLYGKGKIDLPIARENTSIIKRIVSKNGERAVTYWQAIGRKNGNTLLKINLETGRTHQIRVHFSHIGHPLLGDTLYGGDTSQINRQALHCKTIYFTHPITNEKITVDSELPQDIKGLI